MNQNIYEKIAKMHGVTVEEVKREMRAAIDVARTKARRFTRNAWIAKETSPRRKNWYRILYAE